MFGTGFTRSEINSIYLMLPIKEKEDFLTRCYRVVDLFNSRVCRSV